MPRKKKAASKTVAIIRKELLGRKGDWAAITRDTKLGYRWLMAFAHGKIKDPGLARAEKLAQHLGLDLSLNHPPEERSSLPAKADA